MLITHRYALDHSAYTTKSQSKYEEMKQLKAADLRLGNYVWNDVQDLPVRVDMRILSEQQLRERLLKVGTLKEDVLWKPLKITPERLIKMGFENEDGFRFSLRWETGGMQIIEMGHSWYPCIWNNPEMSHEEIPFVVLERIEHVHQLQNLYHAIRQEELEFEL